MVHKLCSPAFMMLLKNQTVFERVQIQFNYTKYGESYLDLPCPLRAEEGLRVDSDTLRY